MRFLFALFVVFAYSNRLKKDGTPDYRYSENRDKGYNMDRSPDYRYSENRDKGYNMDKSPDYRYSENRDKGYNTDKYPDYRYSSNDLLNDQSSTRILYRCVNIKSGTVDYIGVTNDFNRRMQEHRNDDKFYANQNTHFCEIINNSGLSAEQAYQQEIELIKICKSAGQCVYNLNSGGGGPRKIF
jgi:predicted GIY-YIG superfamily endonuclease